MADNASAYCTQTTPSFRTRDSRRISPSSIAKNHSTYYSNQLQETAHRTPTACAHVRALSVSSLLQYHLGPNCTSHHRQMRACTSMCVNDVGIYESTGGCHTCCKLLLHLLCSILRNVFLDSGGQVVNLQAYGQDISHSARTSATAQISTRQQIGSMIEHTAHAGRWNATNAI